MSNPNPSNSELLKSVLEPLLDDFHYWFERSRLFLEAKDVAFLSDEQQADLLARVLNAQQEVSTVQLLVNTLDRQAGVEPSVLGTWHQLVTECWQVALRFHRENSTEKEM